MFVPFHIHTPHSDDGFVRTKPLLEVAAKYGYPALMMSDHGTMGNCMSFHKDVSKTGIKPIIGIELYISQFACTEKNDTNRKLLHMVCCAKNKDGFRDLCRIVSESNKEENFYYKPRLDVNKLATLATDNLLFFTGHLGSILHSYTDTASPSDKVEVGVRTMDKLADLLGKNNLRIEIQRICENDSDRQSLLREIALKTGIKPVACIDAHHVTKEEKPLHNILLCSQFGTTLKKYKKLEYANFFDDINGYRIPTPEEMKVHPPDELANCLEINDICENYSLKESPSLPKFSNNEPEQLKTLCQEGWTRLVNRGILKDEASKTLYADRLKQELDTIHEFNLEGYFLIVHDFITWAKGQRQLVNTRGSAAGCLASYLCGITNIDPIPNNLIFARFLNKGRFTKTNIEYPDIDVDFPIMFKEKVVNYIIEKYGADKVAQIATFFTMKGAGAIKEVLRMHEACSFAEMNAITKDIPGESEISDQLEAQGEDSILMYTLKNTTLLDDFVKLKDGKLTGDFAPYFEQAIQLEGTVIGQGVHAAGLVISPQPLSDICPVVKGKEGPAIGIDMHGAKDRGLVKMDILGVASLDKLMEVNRLLQI